MALPVAYGLYMLGIGSVTEIVTGPEPYPAATHQAAWSGDSDHPGPRGPLGHFSSDKPILVDEEGLAIHGYDVVAYFTKGRPVEGIADHEVVHAGAIFRFSSPEHLERFKAEPEAYVPAYGGYCALGVAGGYKDGMHPEAFEIVDGRLFFNLTPGIHRHWQSRMDELIERADENWPRLKDPDAPGPGLGSGAAPPAEAVEVT